MNETTARLDPSCCIFHPLLTVHTELNYIMHVLVANTGDLHKEAV